MSDRVWCEYNKLLNKYNKYNNKNKLNKIIKLIWMIIRRLCNDLVKIDLIDDVIKMINGDKRKIMRKELKREDCCKMENRLFNILFNNSKSMSGEYVYISVFGEDDVREMNKYWYDKMGDNISCKINVLSAPRLEFVYKIYWRNLEKDMIDKLRDIIVDGKGYFVSMYYYNNIISVEDGLGNVKNCLNKIEEGNELGCYIMNNCKKFCVFELGNDNDNRDSRNGEMRKMLRSIILKMVNMIRNLDEYKNWKCFDDLIDKFNNVYKDCKMVGRIWYDGKVLGVCECGEIKEIIELKDRLGIKYELKYEEFKYE